MFSLFSLLSVLFSVLVLGSFMDLWLEINTLNKFCIWFDYQYYLEPGHTQNEDDFHACLDWQNCPDGKCLCTNAVVCIGTISKESGTRYVVQELARYMKDFKSLGDAYCGNLDGAVSLESPEWQRVKAIRIEKRVSLCFVSKVFLWYSTFYSIHR